MGIQVILDIIQCCLHPARYNLYQSPGPEVYSSENSDSCWSPVHSSALFVNECFLPRFFFLFAYNDSDSVYLGNKAYFQTVLPGILCARICFVWNEELIVGHCWSAFFPMQHDYSEDSLIELNGAHYQLNRFLGKNFR